MNKIVKKYFNAFQNLELNKQTQDVVVDVQNMQIEFKFRYYGYYIAITCASALIIASVLYHVKKDDFRANLIQHNNVSPILSYTYSKYEKELEKAIVEKATTEDKIYHLNKSLPNTGGFSYPYDKFLQEVKSGKVAVDLKVAFQKQINEYMSHYFMAYLLQNPNDKILLGSNEFTYLEISKRVSSLSKSEALKRLETPSHSILTSLSLEKSNSNIESLSNALYGLAQISLNYSNNKFYRELQISKDAENELIKAFLNNERSYKLNSSGFNVGINFPNLSNEYEVALANARKEHQENLSKNAAKVEDIKKEIDELVAKKNKLDELRFQIESLQRDYKNYNVHKQKIEELKKDIKWN